MTGASVGGAVCVYPLMNTIHSDNSTPSGLLHKAMCGLLGALALVALVAAFAVEFAAASPGLQRNASKLLHVGQSATSPG